MRATVILALASALTLSLGGALTAQAQQALDVNGAFAGEGLPTGWAPNRPGYWDDSGTVVLTEVSDLEKNSVRLTSVSRAMSLYTSAWQFAVSAGDKVVVRCLMRGEGAGSLGVYYYPAGGWLKKEVPVFADWSEYAAELTIPEKVTDIRVVIGVPPRASTEFLDLAVEIVKR